VPPRPTATATATAAIAYEARGESRPARRRIVTEKRSGTATMAANKQRADRPTWASGSGSMMVPRRATRTQSETTATAVAAHSRGSARKAARMWWRIRTVQLISAATTDPTWRISVDNAPGALAYK
jgi:hypothetical protein